MIDDLLVYNHLTAMLEGARVAIAGLAATVTLAEGVPHPGVSDLRIAVHPAQPTLDLFGDDCGGELYAWAEGLPSVASGTMAGHAGTPAGAGCPVLPDLGVRFVVGIARCVHGIDADTNPPTMPTVEELDHDARLLYADAQALWRGVLCALGPLDGVGWQLGEVASMAPEGGIAGSELRGLLAFDVW